MAERCGRFLREHDAFRRLIISEPRGTSALVGALLEPPEVASHTAGVVFFNNVGTLGMCGHGTIGLVATLAHLGRIRAGRHVIDTPVGPVDAELGSDRKVAVRNVPCYRFRKDVTVDLPGGGQAVGDIAWGGNWFYLTDAAPWPLEIAHARALGEYCLEIRNGLERAGIRGAEGATIDHVEISGPPRSPRNNSRNFVLCPGGAYDRSPCGTGTSARIACEIAEGRLRPGERWRQEGIVGTVFEGYVSPDDMTLRPWISGSAFMTAESELIVEEGDPFPDGIPE
jgi:4-hydroxyproline epimerase